MTDKIVKAETGRSGNFPRHLEEAQEFFLKITEGRLPSGRTSRPGDDFGFNRGEISGTPINIKGLDVYPKQLDLEHFKRTSTGGMAQDLSKKPEPYFTIAFRQNISTSHDYKKYVETTLQFYPDGTIYGDTMQHIERERSGSHKQLNSPEEVRQLILERAPEFYHRINWDHHTQFSRKWHPREILRRIKSKNVKNRKIEKRRK